MQGRKDAPGDVENPDRDKPVQKGDAAVQEGHGVMDTTSAAGLDPGGGGGQTKPDADGGTEDPGGIGEMRVRD